MSAFRFRPNLESLCDRLTPSSTAPVVVFESLVISAAPAAAHDDVVVDGRIITAENYDYYPLSKPVRLLDSRPSAGGSNETISIDVNRTELPDNQHLRATTRVGDM